MTTVYFIVAFQLDGWEGHSQTEHYKAHCWHLLRLLQRYGDHHSREENLEVRFSARCYCAFRYIMQPKNGKLWHECGWVLGFEQEQNLVFVCILISIDSYKYFATALRDPAKPKKTSRRYFNWKQRHLLLEGCGSYSPSNWREKRWSLNCAIAFLIALVNWRVLAIVSLASNSDRPSSTG